MAFENILRLLNEKLEKEYANMADLMTKPAAVYKELCLLLDKPMLLFSLTVIGFPMMWLASIQAEFCFWCTGYDTNACHIMLTLINLLLIVCFLWVNLWLINKALNNFKIVAPAQPDVVIPPDVPIIRKNPDRACKKKY